MFVTETDDKKLSAVDAAASTKGMDDVVFQRGRRGGGLVHRVRRAADKTEPKHDDKLPRGEGRSQPLISPPP